jgi:PelA/Pel-15E family pectate lyase
MVVQTNKEIMMRFKKYLLSVIVLLASHSMFAQKAITVALDGSGDFKSIQDAINSLPEKATAPRLITIKKGIYKEKIFIDKNFISLRGEDPKQTIITISLAREEWRCAGNDDYGTATINLKGSDIKLENISFINTYGKDNTKDRVFDCPLDSLKKKTVKPTGHQMALRSFATTRLIVINCIFTAYGGDTVSPWNVDNGMFYFKDCTMEGGVDFYCPRGWAYAENCTFICHSKEAAIWHDGSKDKSSKTVLMNCKFIGDDGFKLGRYHREAQFFLVNCHFPANMADADIYQKEAVPPNMLNWGKRVYYYNCHRDGGDYKWHADNLPENITPDLINSNWAFEGKWKMETEENDVVAAVAANQNVMLTTAAVKTSIVKEKDLVAENMLLYQRANGGWPKHFQGDKKVDYNHQLTETELKELRSGYDAGIDATIDNEATTKEIKYLVNIYKKTNNEAYKKAAEKGITYLLKAQYANGGWPQYYPDFSSYRSEITYNDNAMINVLNVLQDVIDGKNGMDVIDRSYVGQCTDAVQRGIDCILKTQLKQNGKLTAWCAQYDAKTLMPAKARKFELASLSGMESVGIARFLMRMDNPTPAIIAAVKGAALWFDKVKIVGYKFVDIVAPSEKSGKDRVLQADPNSIIWARFYDIDTNEPFFSGRDSERKKTIAEVENERRIGYAWYGVWPTKLLAKEFPDWVAKWNIKVN